MGVAITIFTYFGDDEETLSARFYGVKKAFCEAFKGDISIIKEYSFGEETSDYFKNLFHTEQRTPDSWHLWSSMRSIDDIFGYGTEYAVHDKDDNWTVIMPKDVLEDVKRHPEQYAIVKLIYD